MPDSQQVTPQCSICGRGDCTHLAAYQGLRYRGRLVREMTREELIAALEAMHAYYEGQLAGERATADFALGAMRRRFRG